MDSGILGGDGLAIMLLTAARSDWQQVARRIPRLTAADWSGPAAIAYDAAEGEIRRSAAAAAFALDAVVRTATTRRAGA